MVVTTKTKKEALEQMVNKGKINQILYKYRPDGEYTEKIFTDHALWFEHPNNFNDPFDCWANVHEITHSELQTFIKKTSTSDYEKMICLKGIRSYTKNMYKQNVDKALNEIGVCCFSKTPESILMWSHYSDYHKGICLVYDVFEDPDLFTLAKPVIYVDVMPEYNHFTDRNKIIEKIIQPKGKEWAYEEEIRIIKSIKDIKQNGNSQAFKFQPSALKKVIFGCKTTEETKRKYKNLCSQNGFQHVSFSQMNQNRDGRFELEEIMLK